MNQIQFTRNIISISFQHQIEICQFFIQKKKFYQKSLQIQWLWFKVTPAAAKAHKLIFHVSSGASNSIFLINLQLPQMILDDARQNKKRCNIIVTQPRRLATRSIAERVSREREWELGTLVGYQIALESNFLSEDTRITYCTTGVLLEKLVCAKSLSKYSHIIIDEVHERDKHMDFLLILIRILLCKVSPKVKIILMSATIESAKVFPAFG